MHRALADFGDNRPNALSLYGWFDLAEQCGDGLGRIANGLGSLVTEELVWLEGFWPSKLDQSVIHADLFPDNVLMLGDKVTGIIDFYFACTDIRVYDLAVMHAAWCFSEDGNHFYEECSRALLTGYNEVFPISEKEREVLDLLCRGASLRFLLTRAWDWLNTPADALVTRKDPLAFLRRLEFYRSAGSEVFAA